MRSVWWNPALPSSRAHKVRAPICHLSGWFDGLLPPAPVCASTPWILGFARRAADCRFLGTRSGAGHRRPGGLLRFGPEGALDFNAFRLRWYDQHLKGRANGLSRDPRAWLYVNGIDRWIGSAHWPPLDSTPTSGTCARTEPFRAQLRRGPNLRMLTSMPMDPVPVLRERSMMGLGTDQRPVEERLTSYTTPRLKKALSLVGEIKL